jgi:carnitine 3-dehydrogenase
LPIETVAVAGTGLIGASWATYFLGRGLAVIGTDPAPGAEDQLRAYVAKNGGDPARLGFTADLAEAVRAADFVQENAPERLDQKIELFRRMDEAARPGVVLASSSSTLLVSDMQQACATPGRVVLGHPFNPPHLIPLVEVVGGRQTDEASIEAAIAFYRGIGKHPIRLNREILGHVSNRLQAALWRECIHLLTTGVASASDIDAAIAHGPGLRWALLGPFLNLHLSGGEGGIEHNLAHLGPAITAMWRDLGAPELDPTTMQRVETAVREMIGQMDLPAVMKQRDRMLLELVAEKAVAKLP